MFGKCVPIKKKKTGWQNMCFTHVIWIFDFTKHIKLSILQYGTIHILWDKNSFATVKRRRRSLVAQASTLCGNAGLQIFAASLYIITSWVHIYINIYMNLCFNFSIFELSHWLYVIFFVFVFYTWIIKGVKEMRNIGVCQNKWLTLGN